MAREESASRGAGVLGFGEGARTEGGNSGAGLKPGVRKPAPAHLSHRRLCPIVPASERPQDPLGLSIPDPRTPVRLAPPRRSAATATSPVSARSHSPCIVPARFRPRLRRCAPGPALAACSAGGGGKARGARGGEGCAHPPPGRSACRSAPCWPRPAPGSARPAPGPLELRPGGGGAGRSAPGEGRGRVCGEGAGRGRPNSPQRRDSPQSSQRA